MTASSSQITILIPDPDEMMFVAGDNEQNIDRLEREFGVKIVSRGAELRISGEAPAVARVGDLVGAMRTLSGRDQSLRKPALERLIGEAKDAPIAPPSELRDVVATTVRGKRISPQSANQRAYIDAIRKHDLVFAIGPAGTGKSYLAVAMGVAALRDRKVSRLILTRPAVEAGERLGFLPGDLQEKIDPYLRPLYDALYELMPPERFSRAQERGEIEVAPLAYMRGRAQPLFSKVLTPSGFRPIGAIAPGDFVIGSNGHPTQVLGVYPQGRKPVYRVQTQDGASTLASGEHLWVVETPSDKRREKDLHVLETQEMIGRLRAAHAHRFELPLLSAPVHFPVRPVPMDPYALGLLLGDGCLTTATTPSFTTADPELAAALGAAVPSIELFRKGAIDFVLRRRGGGGRGGVITANPVTAILRTIGLAGTRSGTKFVPDDYLYNSSDVRLAVLQGLLDTDGGPVTQRERTCRVQYSTTSPRLKDHVVFLVQSLGGVAYWRKRPMAGRKPGRANGRPVPYRGDAYILEIRLPAWAPPFRLERKRRTYESCGGGRPMRFIDRIDPAGEEETVCIKVAADDSLYVTDDFLVTHNTLNEAFIILDEAQNTTAPQMKMFLTRLGFGSQAVVTGDITQIDLAGERSGLVLARDILRGVDGIATVEFDDRDVVRHELVARIVRAYDRFEKGEAQK